MPIINRVKRLFQADLHALLDSLEDPATLLRQALREMEEALDAKRGQLARESRRGEALETASQRLEEKLLQIDQNLRLAVAASPEETCRKIIARKISLQKYLETLQQHTRSVQQSCQDLTTRIQQQQEVYDSIRERAELLVPPPAEDSPASVAESILSQTPPGAGSREQAVTEEEIELEWLRLQREGGAS